LISLKYAFDIQFVDIEEEFASLHSDDKMPPVEYYKRLKDVINNKLE